VLTSIVDGSIVYRLSWIQVRTSLMLPTNGYIFFKSVYFSYIAVG